MHRDADRSRRCGRRATSRRVTRRHSCLNGSPRRGPAAGGKLPAPVLPEKPLARRFFNSSLSDSNFLKFGDSTIVLRASGFSFISGIQAPAAIISRLRSASGIVRCGSCGRSSFASAFCSPPPEPCAPASLPCGSDAILMLTIGTAPRSSDFMSRVAMYMTSATAQT